MTSTALWLLVLVAVSNANLEGKKSYSRYKVLSVQASNADQVDYLNQLQDDNTLGLNFFQVPSLHRSIDILVPPFHVNRVKKSLESRGMTSQVTVEDMQRVIDAESRGMRSVKNANILDTYLKYDEIVNWLYARNSTHSKIMQLTNIGNSFEGRDIYQVKVSSNFDDTSKPAMWIECLSHAREWITGAVCLGIIEKLTESSTDSARLMLDKFDWYFAPVVNPDGYEYSHDRDRMWRKNRRNTTPLSCVGVDLNRNWDAQHCGKGASTHPCSDVYCGTSGNPISEEENKALQQAVIRTLPNVKAFFSMHSYSQLLLLPFAFDNIKPDDYSELEEVANVAMEALRRENGMVFTVGHTPTLLYAASGGTFDYFKLQGVKYSYVYELRPKTSSGGGFVLPAAEIRPSIEETFASLHSFAEEIGRRES